MVLKITSSNLVQLGTDKKLSLPKLDSHLFIVVEIPRIMRGEKQGLEILMNEEALLFAKLPRNETKEWKPRMPTVDFKGA